MRSDSTLASWRFSLRGLMQVTVACAAASAELAHEGLSWNAAIQAVLVAVSACVCIGLLTQAWDLFKSRPREPAADVRFGYWFAAGWRVATALGLAAYHLLWRLWDPPGEYILWPGPEIVYYVLMVAALAAIPGPVKKNQGRARYLVAAIGAVAASIYVSFVVYELFTVVYLVYIALCGIELTHSSMDSPFFDGLVDPPVQRAVPVAWLGFAATALLPVCLGLLYLWARNWNRGRWRVLLGFAFCIAWSAMTGLFLWNYLVAMPAASPPMMEAIVSGEWLHRLPIFVPCLAAVTLTAAYRLTSRRPDVAGAEQRYVPYLHERGVIPLLLASVLLTRQAVGIFRLGFDLESIAYYLFYQTAPAEIALILLAGQVAWREAFRKGAMHRLPPRPIPPLRFAVVWLAATATTVVGIPVLAVYGFSLWLAEWMP